MAPDIWRLQEVNLPADDMARLNSLSQLGYTHTHTTLHNTSDDHHKREGQHTRCSGGLAIVVNHQAYDLLFTKEGSSTQYGRLFE